MANDQMTNDQWGAVRRQVCGDSGVYCLVLWLPRPCRLDVTRLGPCRLGPGWYVYTGSAKRNLLPRLERHLRRQKNFHWHIDYLRAAASVREIWIWPWIPGGECRTNAEISLLPDATSPLKGFGASDCWCQAHLVSFPSKPVPPDSGAPLRFPVRGTRLIPAEP